MLVTAILRPLGSPKTGQTEDAIVDSVAALADPKAIFSGANAAALVGWAILILLPRRFALLFAIPRFVIPGGLAALYALLVFANIYTGEGGFGSIEDVRRLFDRDAMLVAGWLHYLAFDLFVGCWIARKSDRLGIPRLIQTPILLATFMFGPVGLLLYLCMRPFYRRAGQAAS